MRKIRRRQNKPGNFLCICIIRLIFLSAYPSFLSLSPQRKCLPWGLLQLWPASTAEAPPGSLPPCLARLLPQKQKCKDDNHTLLAAYALTCSSSHHHHHLLLAAGPHPQLSLKVGPAVQLLSTSLTTAARLTTGPTQHLTHLAFNLRLWPCKPPLGPQCP